MKKIEFIIGVIDKYGQILSRGFESIADDYADETHWKYWEERHKRWRWNKDEGFYTISEADINIAEWDDIAHHCRKYYKVW